MQVTLSETLFEVKLDFTSGTCSLYGFTGNLLSILPANSLDLSGLIDNFVPAEPVLFVGPVQGTL